MQRAIATACAGLCLVFASSRCVRAQTRPSELAYDTKIDLPVAIGGAVVWLGSELLLKSALAPSACRWCKPPGIDESVRDALKWNDPRPADTISNILGFGLLPAALVGVDALMAHHDHAMHDFGPDVLIIAEATVIAMDVNQIVKFAVGRERPFVHALSADAKARVSMPTDNDLSFFSGHTTGAFAIAVATGTVASMRGYRWAPVAWVVGPVLAITTGYLRIAADKHYFTDVLTGAVIGSAFGFVLPYGLHSARSGGTGMAVGALGASTVVFRGVW